MFSDFLRRFSERVRPATARNAASGTYEAIRRSVIYSRSQTRQEVENRIFAALGSRRSWKRLDDSTFEVRWAKNHAMVHVETPLDIGRFMRDVADAEISVFCHATDPKAMQALKDTGRAELRRLFERDGLPWVDLPGT